MRPRSPGTAPGAFALATRPPERVVCGRIREGRLRHLRRPGGCAWPVAPAGPIREGGWPCRDTAAGFAVRLCGTPPVLIGAGAVPRLVAIVGRVRIKAPARDCLPVMRG